MKNHSPTESFRLSWAVYDVFAEMRKAAAPLRESSGLSPSEKQAQMNELKAQTERRLLQVMGVEKFERYYTRRPDNFRWINELDKE